jgi:hypothetical protein
MAVKSAVFAVALMTLTSSGMTIWEAQAATTPQTGFGGPNIPGVCILNQQAVFNGSKVGVFANTHYKQMHDGAQTAVNAEEAKIVADAKALQAKKLQGPQLQQAQQALAKRFAELRAKAAKDSQALETTTGCGGENLRRRSASYQAGLRPTEVRIVALPKLGPGRQRWDGYHNSGHLWT